MTQRRYITAIVLLLVLIGLCFIIIGLLNENTAVQEDILCQVVSINQEVETPCTGQVEALGQYEITFYCSCESCCGKSDGITASGTMATEGRTIAVTQDGNIPLGSTVIIDGHSYTAEDYMSDKLHGNLIDIYCDDHQEALSRGVIEREVYQ